MLGSLLRQSADLRANLQGTGFAVTDEGGHTILIDFCHFSAPLGGLVASLRSEDPGILYLSYIKLWRTTTDISRS